MKVLRAPAPLTLETGAKSVFLAGSVERGITNGWQQIVARALDDLDVVVLDPVRPDWDASWTQSIGDERFRTQVQWQFDALERADLVAMHFVPGTQSPITLLELGFMARSGKLAVSCGTGFWRRGEVEVLCARCAIPIAENLDALIAEIRRQIS